MDWVTASFVIVMFGLGYTLGRLSGKEETRIALGAFYRLLRTVDYDMTESPRGPFEGSQTVRLVRENTHLFDWAQEGDD